MTEYKLFILFQKNASRKPLKMKMLCFLLYQEHSAIKITHTHLVHQILISFHKKKTLVYINSEHIPSQIEFLRSVSHLALKRDYLGKHNSEQSSLRNKRHSTSIYACLL